MLKSRNEPGTARVLILRSSTAPATHFAAIRFYYMYITPEMTLTVVENCFNRLLQVSSAFYEREIGFVDAGKVNIGVDQQPMCYEAGVSSARWTYICSDKVLTIETWPAR